MAIVTSLTAQPNTDTVVDSTDILARIVEDTLLVVAVVALCSEPVQRADVILDLIDLLLEASERDRIQAACDWSRREVDECPDWICSDCDEANPPTFGFCWHCGEPVGDDAETPSDRSLELVEFEALREQAFLTRLRIIG